MPDGNNLLRQTACIRTLFDTSHPFDAGLAGFDGPMNPDHEAEGFRVILDGRGKWASVTITGPEGEVTLHGHAQIMQLTDALMAAEQIAKRMEERVA